MASVIFECRIRSDNDAFQDGNAIAELVDVLKGMITQIENCSGRSAGGRLFDVNGNRIGTFDLEVEDEDTCDRDTDS